MGIYSPRFAINCFKTSQEDNKVGDVIEPWMYPDVTSIIRQAIKRRYELLPFLYSLTIESHLFATPAQRWVGWGCENDSVVWANAELREGERQYWLGNSLMIGGVFEPGQASTRFYLPKGRNDDLGFVHLDPDKKFHHFSAGQWVTVQSYWRDGTSIFAKLGSAIPIGRRENCLSPGETENPANLPLDDYRGIEIYPPAGDHGDRKFGSTWYEDDGFTEGCPISRFSLHYYCRKDHIVVSFEKDCPPNEKRYWSELYILVPSTDSRIIYDGNGRKLWSEGPTIAGLSRYVLQLAEV
jgi:alpha-glucosidase (family GH31 glycosyl hydrolase)